MDATSSIESAQSCQATLLSVHQIHQGLARVHSFFRAQDQHTRMLVLACLRVNFVNCVATQWAAAEPACILQMGGIRRGGKPGGTLQRDAVVRCMGVRADVYDFVVQLYWYLVGGLFPFGIMWLHRTS